MWILMILLEALSFNKITVGTCDCPHGVWAASGSHLLSWDTRDMKNNFVPSGTYFYKCELENIPASRGRGSSKVQSRLEIGGHSNYPSYQGKFIIVKTSNTKE